MLKNQAPSLNPQDSIVKAAYNQAIAAIEKGSIEESDRSGETIASIDKVMSNIEVKRKEIVSNAATAEEALKKHFREAIISLHDITQLKLSALLSSEADLRRRAEELTWLDNFMHYQKDIIPPIAFLDSFSQHTIVRRSKAN